MQDTRVYTADFYRAEVEKTILELQQGIDDKERVRLQNKLAAARAYLADLEGKK